MATGIGNATETALHGSRPLMEKSRSSSAANGDLSGDAQAFAAALEGQARAQMDSPDPPVMQAAKPLLSEAKLLGQCGEMPAMRVADIFAKAGDTRPPDSPTPLERPIQFPGDSTGAALPPRDAKQPEASSRETAVPPRKPPTPTSPATDTNFPNTLAASADSEPARRTAGSGSTGDKTDPNPTAAVAPGDSILRGLQGQPEPESASTASPAAAPDARFDEIAEKVAARILVADRSAGAPEVRIMLNESHLNGAEVRVRQDGGQIVVEFASLSPESQSFLRERGNGLQQALQERLGGEVRVEIRSQDTGRDPQDGRSRQHRSMQDEWEAER